MLKSGKTRHNKIILYIIRCSVCRPILNNLDRENPFLINALRSDHIQPTSGKKYNFSVTVENVNKFGQFGQPEFLDQVIFKRAVKDGFFIEAGADDFERDSNTLLFEIEHNWTGLLVEPNPVAYPKG